MLVDWQLRPQHRLRAGTKIGKQQLGTQHHTCNIANCVVLAAIQRDIDRSARVDNVVALHIHLLTFVKRSVAGRHLKVGHHLVHVGVVGFHIATAFNIVRHNQSGFLNALELFFLKKYKQKTVDWTGPDLFHWSSLNQIFSTDTQHCGRILSTNGRRFNARNKRRRHKNQTSKRAVLTRTKLGCWGSIDEMRSNRSMLLQLLRRGKKNNEMHSKHVAKLTNSSGTMGASVM